MYMHHIFIRSSVSEQLSHFHVNFLLLDSTIQLLPPSVPYTLMTSTPGPSSPLSSGNLSARTHLPLGKGRNWAPSRTIYWIHRKKVKLKVTQLCSTLCYPMDYIVQGILQARIQEWVAFPFSRGSSQPRDWTHVSCIAGGFFTSWATREACWIHRERDKTTCNSLKQRNCLRLQ